ncbi:MAG: sigma-70 family RNA polymerase sigma factor [Clostridia bacterium]|nr:sigma-70 family RNA polymerase sigma factor [Clostridia bacterium]
MNDREIERALLQLEPRLFVIAGGYLRCREDRQDAVQECLYKAWLHHDKLRNSAFFSTWVIRILKNECVNMLRARRELPCSDGLAADAEDQLESLIEHDALKSAMKRMGARERRILYLRYYGGYRLKEIAQITREPLGTVQSRLYRSLRKITDQMKIS